MNGKTFWWWPTDPLMQSIVHSSLSKALVINNIVHTNLSKICRVTSYIWSDTYRRYVSCIGSNVSRYVSYRIIQTIHNPTNYTRLTERICILSADLDAECVQNTDLFGSAHIIWLGGGRNLFDWGYGVVQGSITMAPRLWSKMGHSAHFAAKCIYWWSNNNANGGRKRIPWNNGVGEKGVARIGMWYVMWRVVYIYVCSRRAPRCGMFSRADWVPLHWHCH